MPDRLIIVGLGFAGMWSALAAARAADRADKALEITVVASEPALHIRPRFYEADLSVVAPSVRELLDVTGVRFVRGWVERIDTGERTITYADPEAGAASLGWDRLVLASGSVLHRPALPGLAEHAFDIDQLAAANVLQDHLLSLGSMPASPARDTIVVVGGGFTGIEIATELPGRLGGTLGARAAPKIVLVEQAEAIGPDLGPGPRPVIEKALATLGIEVRLNESVVAVDADGVTTASGARIAAATVIWTAGLRASPLTRQIPGRHDAIGRLHVTPELRVEGVDTVFATGDCAFAATDDLGNHALMFCQHALSLGRAAGHNAAADLLGLPMHRYSQPKYVTCLDLGGWGAVYTEGWEREVKMAGADAKALKRQINGEWIYPPPADRDAAFAAADPATVIVA